MNKPVVRYILKRVELSILASAVEFFLSILINVWNFCVKELRLLHYSVDIDKLSGTRDAGTIYDCNDFLGDLIDFSNVGIDNQCTSSLQVNTTDAEEDPLDGVAEPAQAQSDLILDLIDFYADEVISQDESVLSRPEGFKNEIFDTTEEYMPLPASCIPSNASHQNDEDFIRNKIRSPFNSNIYSKELLEVAVDSDRQISEKTDENQVKEDYQRHGTGEGDKHFREIVEIFGSGMEKIEISNKMKHTAKPTDNGFLQACSKNDNTLKNVENQKKGEYQSHEARRDENLKHKSLDYNNALKTSQRSEALEDIDEFTENFEMQENQQHQVQNKLDLEKYIENGFSKDEKYFLRNSNSYCVEAIYNPKILGENIDQLTPDDSLDCDEQKYIQDFIFYNRSPFMIENNSNASEEIFFSDPDLDETSDSEEDFITKINEEDSCNWSDAHVDSVPYMNLIDIQNEFSDESPENTEVIGDQNTELECGSEHFTNKKLTQAQLKDILEEDEDKDVPACDLQIGECGNFTKQVKSTRSEEFHNDRKDIKCLLKPVNETKFVHFNSEIDSFIYDPNASVESVKSLSCITVLKMADVQGSLKENYPWLVDPSIFEKNDEDTLIESLRDQFQSNSSESSTVTPLECDNNTYSYGEIFNLPQLPLKDTIEIHEDADEIHSQIDTKIDTESQVTLMVNENEVEQHSEIGVKIEIKAVVSQMVNEVVEKHSQIDAEIDTASQVSQTDNKDEVEKHSDIDVEKEIGSLVSQMVNEIVKKDLQIGAEIDTASEVSHMVNEDEVEKHTKIGREIDSKSPFSLKVKEDKVEKNREIGRKIDSELQVSQKVAKDEVEKHLEIGKEIDFELQVSQKIEEDEVEKHPEIHREIDSELQVSQKVAEDEVEKHLEIGREIDSELQVSQMVAEDEVEKHLEIHREIDSELQVSQKVEENEVEKHPEISREIDSELQVSQMADKDEIEKLPEIGREIDSELKVSQKAKEDGVEKPSQTDTEREVKSHSQKPTMLQRIRRIKLNPISMINKIRQKSRKNK